MMKKENIIISSIVVCIMLFIQACGLTERIGYENERRQIYLSANADDINASGLNFSEVLSAYKEAGVNFVTVTPKTVADFEADGKLSCVTYSSLSINDDPVSAAILPLLSPYGVNEKSLVIISVIPDMSNYIRKNLSGMYPKDFVIEVNPDETTAVFCLPECTQKDVILGYDEGELYAVKKAGMKTCLQYDAYTFDYEGFPSFFEEFLNEYKPEFLILRNSENENKVHLSHDFKDVLKNSGMTLTVFENENQISNEKPYIYKDMKRAFSDRVVRGFNMDKVISYDETKYMYRYYQWYNSALERNTTFLNVNILKNPDKESEENLSLTLDAVGKLQERLSRLGYTFPDKASVIPYRYKLIPSAMCGSVILIILLYVYLTLLGISKSKNAEIYVLLLCAAAMILSFVFYDSLTKYYALLTMITVCSLITLILFKADKAEISRRKKILYMTLAPLALIVTGAVSETALLSDFDFFLGDKWFEGVKISLTVPLLAVVYNACVVYENAKKPSELKELLKKTKEYIKKIPKYALITGAVLILAVLAYYLIRTGKSSLVLPIEDKFRKKLTDIFVIRPRFKEFLIGYPALSLFIYFSVFRKNRFWKTVFGLLSAMLFTSVLNTFCHTFTPVWVSSLRFLTGLIAGLAVSAAIIGILELIRFLRSKIIKNKQ